ncbi:MAG: MarR family transcriptional regulator [Actinobacteria bacterium]|nr:MarR family transcriptional regulator [Actinomycetota bacterium]MBU1943719.1 MarR family transcriptional regulator [Actinomycetota bacterium]MBU2688546.1 MarR family transcriptional regulator [Actinomycetota bacterium]
MTKKEDEQLDKFIADLWVAITRIIKRTRHMGGAAVDEHDLTPPQIFTMWMLQENEPLTMGELSEQLAVTHGVATRMVDRLLAKGMVVRHRDQEDRRVVRISLTDLGREVTQGAAADALVMIRRVFEDVSQQDREEYLALLGRIEEAQAGGPGVSRG